MSSKQKDFIPNLKHYYLSRYHAYKCTLICQFREHILVTMGTIVKRNYLLKITKKKPLYETALSCFALTRSLPSKGGFLDVLIYSPLALCINFPNNLS